MTAILREERIGGQRLILGDCLAVMPGLGRFDAVVTDPPYGLGKKLARGGHFADHREKLEAWDSEARQEWADAILALGGGAIIWGGNYFRLPPTRCWLIWNKINAVPSMADFEQAWTNLDRPSKRIDLPVGRDEFGHPTTKPLPLMLWCLGFLPGARTIFDPLMGSGTTLVACQRMGRAGTGIELDPDYFDIACRRVDEAARQPDLLIAQDAPPPPRQEGLPL